MGSERTSAASPWPLALLSLVALALSYSGFSNPRPRLELTAARAVPIGEPSAVAADRAEPK